MFVLLALVLVAFKDEKSGGELFAGLGVFLSLLSELAELSEPSYFAPQLVKFRVLFLPGLSLLLELGLQLGAPQPEFVVRASLSLSTLVASYCLGVLFPHVNRSLLVLLGRHFVVRVLLL